MADQFNSLLNSGVEIPKWMTTGKTVLCLKDPKQRKCGRQLSTNNLLAFDVEADDRDSIKCFI